MRGRPYGPLRLPPANTISAVPAAVDTAWSTGQLESQINRLTMIKGQRYGRAGLKLLRALVLLYSTAVSTGPTPRVASQLRKSLFRCAQSPNLAFT